MTRVLERVIAERGRPDNTRSDNGPELTSRRMLAWAGDWKVGLVHIQPGRPMQNGGVEEYDCERPHSSLDHRTPKEFKLASTTTTSYRTQKLRL